jgi:hypothetical protein
VLYYSFYNLHKTNVNCTFGFPKIIAMNDYIRRGLKFFFYITAIFILVLYVIPMISGDKAGSLNEILHERRFKIFLAFIVAYGFLFPAITFTRLKRHLNGTFEDNREIFDQAFSNYNYIKTEETPDKVVYRKKAVGGRLIQLYEDAITVFTNEDPVIISGNTKYVSRVNRLIDQLIQRKSED